jgi:hypothetical protein
MFDVRKRPQAALKVAVWAFSLERCCSIDRGDRALVDIMTFCATAPSRFRDRFSGIEKARAFSDEGTVVSADLSKALERSRELTVHAVQIFHACRMAIELGGIGTVASHLDRREREIGFRCGKRAVVRNGCGMDVRPQAAAGRPEAAAGGTGRFREGSCEAACPIAVGMLLSVAAEA